MKKNWLSLGFQEYIHPLKQRRAREPEACLVVFSKGRFHLRISRGKNSRIFQVNQTVRSFGGGIPTCGKLGFCFGSVLGLTSQKCPQETTKRNKVSTCLKLKKTRTKILTESFPHVFKAPLCWLRFLHLYCLNDFSAKTIVLVRVYKQQFQGTILLMVGLTCRVYIYICIYMHLHLWPCPNTGSQRMMFTSFLQKN